MPIYLPPDISRPVSPRGWPEPRPRVGSPSIGQTPFSPSRTHPGGQAEGYYRPHTGQSDQHWHQGKGSNLRSRFQRPTSYQIRRPWYMAPLTRVARIRTLLRTQSRYLLRYSGILLNRGRCLVVRRRAADHRRPMEHCDCGQIPHLAPEPPSTYRHARGETPPGDRPAAWLRPPSFSLQPSPPAPLPATSRQRLRRSLTHRAYSALLALPRAVTRAHGHWSGRRDLHARPPGWKSGALSG